MKDIKSVIESIKNPESGETLHSEGRIKELSIGDNSLDLTYDREGITPQQKRQIEDIIVNELSNQIDEDNIIIKTVSKNSSDVHGAKPKPKQEQPANLKVGHGSLPQKRKIESAKNIIAVSYTHLTLPTIE